MCCNESLLCCNESLLCCNEALLCCNESLLCCNEALLCCNEPLLCCNESLLCRNESLRCCNCNESLLCYGRLVPERSSRSRTVSSYQSAYAWSGNILMNPNLQIQSQGLHECTPARNQGKCRIRAYDNADTPTHVLPPTY